MASPDHTRRRARTIAACTLTLLLLPALDLGAQTCTAPSFVRQDQAYAGPTPAARQIVSADFNRDGHRDVAFWILNTGVGVRLGTGPPGYALGPEAVYPSGPAPIELRTGDFNRDGLLDLAVADSTSPAGVSILLATGSGGVFAPPVAAPPVLAGPSGLAVADLNHDGALDIVVSSPASVTVDLLLGLGNGAFAAAVPIAVGGAANQVTAGDVLRDGNPDLVVVDSAASVIRVVPGNGNGTFATPLTAVPVNNAPWGIHLADWNHDGDLDAVVTGTGTAPGVSVLLGNGTGVLASRADYPTTTPASVVLQALSADVDGDGDLDIAATHLASSKMSVLLNNGAGVFGPPTEYDTTAASSFGLTVGDFNWDGRTDVVTSNPGLPFLSIFSNNFGVACTRPSFGLTPQRVAGGGSAEAIAAGDWDGDGRPDIFTADFDEEVHRYEATDGAFQYLGTVSSEPGSAPVWLVLDDIVPGGGPDLLIVHQDLDEIVVLESGGGSTTYSVGATPAAAVVADLNGDGIKDIAVTNLDDGDISLLYGNGSGFNSEVRTPNTGGFPLGLVAGDFREDGFPDLLVADEDGPVWLLPNSPSGFVGAPEQVATLFGPSYVVAGQFGGSPALDAMVTDTFNDEVVLLVGDGAGGFGLPTSYSVPTEPLGVDAGDLNGDGYPDVAVACGGEGSAWVLMGLPGGGFAAPVEHPAGGLQVGIVVQDLTGDGLEDVAVANGRGAHILVGSPTGDGSLEQPSRIALPEDGDALRLSDLDNDGDQDLVVVHTAAAEIRVALGAGDGTFGTLTSYSMPSSPRFLVIADFNNDGIPDLVVSRSSADNISIMLGVGDGTFGAPSSLAANDNPTQMAAGDFNRDGNLDLAVVNDVDAVGGGVTIFLGNGAGGLALSGQVGQANAPQAIAASDFDRNGILDLVVAYAPSAANHYFVPLLGNVSGGFTTGTAAFFADPAFDPSRVVSADFNRDGPPDVAVAARTIGQVEVQFGGGDGLFYVPSTTFIEGEGADLAVADWDSDGWPQLAVAEGDGESVAFTPNVAFLQPIRFRHATSSPANGVAAGDLNGDGRTDLVALEAGVNGHTIAVLLNTNCQPRRLRIDQQPSTCGAPSSPFATQPVLSITDDAFSTLACADGGPANIVTASLLPNTYGGVLTGDPTETATAGAASFVDLGVSTAGRSYQLGFSHPAAGVARSRMFSQGLGLLGLGITGQASVCSVDSPLTYLTAEGYDSYAWTLSGSPVASATWKAILGPLPAGSYSLNVAVTQDGCPASATPFPLTSSIDLSAVSLSVVGSTEVPDGGGAGGTVTATPTGGDVVRYQWRYQKSGGSVRDIGGLTTDPAYVITGSDFTDGPGTYDLWVVATPDLCGTSQTSSPVTLTVYTATGDPADAVLYLTATARGTQVTLEWVNPALGGDYVGNRIQYTEGPTCTAPAGLNEGTSLGTHVGTEGQKDAYTDSSLANGLTRCYSVFVEKDDPGGTLIVSPERSITARTIDTGEDPSWVFSTQMSVVTPPGVGGGLVYVVSNDSRLYSIGGGGGAGSGVWAPAWTPKPFTNPSEGRPTAIPLTGAFSPVIYLGSDNGLGGGLLHAINPATGGDIWPAVTLAHPVLATPSATFTQFGGFDDLVLVGTRNTLDYSTFYARDPLDGSAVWEFSGDPTNRIGLVNAQASVDYLGDRVYFTSTEFVAGDDTVWCLELATGQSCSPWIPPSLGDLFTSPIPRGDILYVAPADGTVRGLDIDDIGNDGTEEWSFTTNDGSVKDFVFPAFGSSDVYFSTNTTVWCRTDTGAALAAKWSVTTIPNPSTPILAVERNEVWVGSGDGKLHVLDASTGAPLGSSPYVLADTGTVIGSPTIDRDAGYVYVGAVDGRVYAVPLP